MTTYTIFFDNAPEATESGVSAQEAMHLLLTHDGGDYKIEKRVDGLYLVLRSPRTRRWLLSTIYVIGTDEMMMLDEIARKVIRSGHWTKPEIWTDAAYANFQASAETNA